ncbi:MAG: FAD-dependent 5-carboxymethylaminomethyl-2-thiouridine(34) oxidoreductase MnmC [Burkholderiaceae bacterium]
MKQQSAEALRQARIDFSDPAAPRSLDYDDIYHPRAGAREQAQQVFLRGNGLPARWAGRQRFVVLETGFGLGHNFLATWAAWRDDPKRCDQLWFVSVEKHPADRADLQRAHAASPWPKLVDEWLAAWPPATPDLHAIDLDAGRVMLRLAFGDVAHWLPRLMLRADAIYLDGFAPARNPAMWSSAVLQRLRHLAAPGATAATWSVARSVRDGLQRAGFEVERVEGFGAKREQLVARFAPSYAMRTPPGLAFGGGGRDVAVVGAGLAGAAAAAALKRHGIAAQVFEQDSEAAHGASGNEAGLLHGVVHAEDGPYARWHRAAFLRAAATLRGRIAAQSVRGDLGGLLRIASGARDAGLRDRIGALGLPADYVQWLDVEAARERAGVALDQPAWWYPAGGWVSPRSVVIDDLRRAGVALRSASRVERLASDANGRWRLLDAQGRTLAVVDHVVLANAHDAVRLAGAPPGAWQSTRGQVTLLPAGAGLGPKRPLAGSGYAIALPDGRVLCGATRDAGDDDASLREHDHRRNLAPWRAIGGDALAIDAATLDGRVGWRLETADRLPWIGALPLPDAPRAPRDDQPRFVPRWPGLHILAGLGSRGLAQSALGAEIVAAWISGAPMPVGRDVLDAVDAARFVARAKRFRSASS